jgi:hypothetical protein
MVRSLQRRLAPDLKGLYAEARILRDIVLSRLAAVGCEIDEKSLAKAQAIVSANIGELVATPEYEILLGYPSGENRILTLLVQSCAAEIAARIRAEKRRKSTPARARRETQIRLAAENGQLL